MHGTAPRMHPKRPAERLRYPHWAQDPLDTGPSPAMFSSWTGWYRAGWSMATKSTPSGAAMAGGRPGRIGLDRGTGQPSRKKVPARRRHQSAHKGDRVRLPRINIRPCVPAGTSRSVEREISERNGASHRLLISRIGGKTGGGAQCRLLCSGTAQAVRYYSRKTGRLAPLR